jgi:hypothetical protein
MNYAPGVYNLIPTQRKKLKKKNTIVPETTVLSN